MWVLVGTDNCFRTKRFNFAAEDDFSLPPEWNYFFWQYGIWVLSQNGILLQNGLWNSILVRGIFHSDAKSDFGAGSNCYTGENETPFWQKRKKCSAAKLGGLCSEKNWIFFIQYTYMSGPNKPSIRLVLYILAVLEGRKEKNPRKQTLSPDPLPQWAREPD